MRTVSKLLLSCVMLFTLLPDAALHASDRNTLFDSNWKFHLGIVANAEQPEYNDSRWRVLDLPHDWSVEPLSFQKQGITTGPFSRMSEGDIDTGQTVGGEAGTEKNSLLQEAMLINVLSPILKEYTISPSYGSMVRKPIIMFMDIPLIV